MNEKDIAVAFIQGVVTDNIQDIYKLYTAANFTHHNPYFKNDKESLLAGMIEDNEKHPNKKLTVKKIVAETPYVAVHAHVWVADGLEIAVVHLYRFENSKIAELWDISQVIPNEIINTHGMF